jgi:uncharacterized protein (TIGR03435 family)
LGWQHTIAATFWLLATAVGTLSAQIPDTFEVASLKPSLPGTRFTSKLDAAQFNCTAHSLLNLIQSAYPDFEVQTTRVAGGPAWLDTERWDLAAKLPPGMPAEQEPLYRKTEQMLRTLLAEEFGLKVHRETRDQPVYALVVAKNGSKLKPSEGGQFALKYANGRLEFHHQSMPGLVAYLSYNPRIPNRPTDRLVIDQTGLDGFFDFTLEWTPDTQQTDPGANGPSIFTALEEQLGLKLQPQRSPVDFLVIDHAEKPSESR